MNSRVEIQAQDKSGNWRTYSVVDNIPQRIFQEMRALQSRLRDYRVRAVDIDSGRLVDII